MTGLRRLEGVDPSSLLDDTGHDLESQSSLAALLDDGRVERHEGRLRIPERHWPTGDAITVELMV